MKYFPSKKKIQKKKLFWKEGSIFVIYVEDRLKVVIGIACMDANISGSDQNQECQSNSAALHNRPSKPRVFTSVSG